MLQSLLFNHNLLAFRSYMVVSGWRGLPLAVTSHLTGMYSAIKMLNSRIRCIEHYLQDVKNGMHAWPSLHMYLHLLSTFAELKKKCQSGYLVALEPALYMMRD